MAKSQRHTRALLLAWHRSAWRHRAGARLLAKQVQCRWQHTGQVAWRALLLQVRRHEGNAAAARAAGRLATAREHSLLCTAARGWWGVSSKRANGLALAAARIMRDTGKERLCARLLWGFRALALEARHRRAAVERSQLLTEGGRLRLELSDQEKGQKQLEKELEAQRREMRRLRHQNKLAKERIQQIAGFDSTDEGRIASPAALRAPRLPSPSPETPAAQACLAQDMAARLKERCLSSPLLALPCPSQLQSPALEVERYRQPTQPELSLSPSQAPGLGDHLWPGRCLGPAVA